MIVLRDEQRIARLGRISQFLSLGALLALVGGLLVIFINRTESALIYQLMALVVGLGLSQVGLYLAHRFLRKPRPDQMLDKAVGKFARKDGRLYHYLLPAPHVLLLPSAVVVLVAKYQTGRIQAEGDKWTQSGIGLQRFFGQAGLGNPTKDAQTMTGKMTDFIEKEAPAAKDAPIFPIIVFTAPSVERLEVSESSVPAMLHTKLNGYLRQQKALQKPMPPEAYAALRTAFDRKAGGLAEETVDEPVE